MPDDESMNNDDVDDMFDQDPPVDTEASSQPASPPEISKSISAVHGVDLEISAILGTAQMPVSQLLKMGRGAVVELDKFIGDTIDLSINDQLIARGEVMIKEDRLCIEITEMVRRTGD